MTPGLRKLLKRLSFLGREERGATAVEWAVLAACIAAVAVVGIGNMGQSLKALFERALTIIGANF